jgi:hypothetical protein
MKDEDMSKLTKLMNLYEAALRCHGMLRYWNEINSIPICGKVHRVDFICDDLFKQIEALMPNEERDEWKKRV